MYNTRDYLFNIRSNFNALFDPKQITHVVHKSMTIGLLFFLLLLLLSHMHKFHCILLIPLNRIEKLLSQFCRIDKKIYLQWIKSEPFFSVSLFFVLVSFCQIFQSIFQTSHFFFSTNSSQQMILFFFRFTTQLIEFFLSNLSVFACASVKIQTVLSVG